MRPATRLLLYWTPRAFSVLYLFFFTCATIWLCTRPFPPLMAEVDFWHRIKMVLFFLQPVAAVALILLLSWRWEWIGGILFTIAGIAFATYWGEQAPLRGWLIFFIPMVLIGMLFLIGWVLRKRMSASPPV